MAVYQYSFGIFRNRGIEVSKLVNWNLRVAVQRFMERRVTLNTMAITLGIVILIGLISWARVTIRSNREINDYAATTATCLAQSMAEFGRGDIVDRKWEQLQWHAENIAKTRQVAYIAVVDASGVSVVHTNRSLRGRPFTRENGKNLMQASVSLTRQLHPVAVIWVGTRIHQ
jgi:sensor histidine kinase regulating citrate/malate metabolism